MPVCTSCQKELADGREAVVIKGKRREADRIVCRECAESLSRIAHEETENPNLPLAFIFGAVAAALACAAWYAFVVLTEKQYAFIAVGVGYVVGSAVMFGAGHKRGVTLQVYSVLLTVLAMAFSEYFIARHFAIEALAREGNSLSVPLLLPLRVISEIIGESLKNDPITLLFWAVAAWVAFGVPNRRVAEQRSAAL